MTVTDDGISTHVSDSHLMKANSSMDATDDGILMSSSDEQPAKA